MRLLKLSAAILMLWLSAARAGAQATPPQTPPPKPAAPAAPPDPHAGHNKAAELSAAAKYFSDVGLLDQDGRPLRLYTDVLKGKTVVVNAFFTTCTSVCPLMNRNLEKIQEAFAERVGKDLFLVSITVDPATDTPPRLKEYARKFNARPGWTFLTGKKENVDWALYKLGQYVENKDDHKTVVIIGNERTGLWKKAFGLAQSDELVKIVRSVLEDKGAAGQE